jgi:hypothetical protein
VALRVATLTCVITDNVPSTLNQKLDDAFMRTAEEEEEAQLWSHFDNWDWDTILPILKELEELEEEK